VLTLPLTSNVANASSARVVVAGLSPIPTTDVVVNKVITTSFDLALAQQNQNKLAPFIASLSDTSSANYHHFLSPSQYAQRFGASASTVSKVRAFLASYGLHVGALSKGRNILHVSGTTSAIARAFDAPVETVRRSDGTLVAHFNAAASLPHSLAHDVVAVAGLSSAAPETTSAVTSHVVTAPSTCPSAGSTTSNTPNSVGGYTAQQQAQLYGLTTAWAAGDTGAGQTLGIYELANYNSNDVATYFTCYGLTPNITALNVDGGPTADDNAGGASEEATLDVEEASVLAPGATFVVYQGTNSSSGPTDTYSQIASDDTASIVTTSWGGCEPQSDGGAQAEMPIFEEMAAQGQTVVSAAGDDGSSDCEGAGSLSPTKALAVDDPSSQPYVTGVGGLSVSSINPLTETVWNDNCTASDCGASGGGVSGLWTQPTWQTANGITTSGATGGMRMVPDLSVMGDPSTGFIEYYTGSTGSCRHSCSAGWGGIGGTSIGAPLVSALVAVAAQTCNPAGGRLGFINPALYAMSATGYNDVTTGNNDLYNVGQYNAGPGYDMASGLGSPNGAAFLAGLCPPAFSPTLSSFALSSSNGVALSSGPTVNATLRYDNGDPVVNAFVDVTATAPKGLLSIDGDHFSMNGLGKATYQITSDANGAVSFSVSSSIAQDVAVNVTYDGQSIYTTSLTFKIANIATSKPGAPAISKLTSLVAGFSLTLSAPSDTGGGPIKSYQYSINGGATWISLAKGATSINVTKLLKGHAYRVIVRAINAVGPSAASKAKKVVTRL
jgi:subtilase family serine protease